MHLLRGKYHRKQKWANSRKQLVWRLGLLGLQGVKPELARGLDFPGNVS
jgi:hypothetical protein